MSDPNQPSTPAGWYPDGQGGQRWWDGTRWTEHTMPGPGAQPAQPAQPQQPAEQTPPADPTVVAAPSGTPPQGPPPQGPPPQAPPAQFGTQQQQPDYAQPDYAQQGYPQQGQPGGVPPWQTPQGGGGSGKGKGKGKLIALIAAGVALLVVLALVLVFFVLGGGGPKGVAEDFLDAQYSGDQEEVCELTSADRIKETLESNDVKDCGALEDKLADDEDTKEFTDLIDDIDSEVKIGDVSEKDDESTVEYTADLEYTGSDEERFKELFGGETKFTEKGTLTLVKEDGDWKVSDNQTD